MLVKSKNKYKFNHGIDQSNPILLEKITFSLLYLGEWKQKYQQIPNTALHLSQTAFKTKEGFYNRPHSLEGFSEANYSSSKYYIILKNQREERGEFIGKFKSFDSQMTVFKSMKVVAVAWTQKELQKIHQLTTRLI